MKVNNITDHVTESFMTIAGTENNPPSSSRFNNNSLVNAKKMDVKVNIIGLMLYRGGRVNDATRLTIKLGSNETPINTK